VRRSRVIGFRSDAIKDTPESNLRYPHLRHLPERNAFITTLQREFFGEGCGAKTYGFRDSFGVPETEHNGCGKRALGLTQNVAPLLTWWRQFRRLVKILPDGRIARDSLAALVAPGVAPVCRSWDCDSRLLYIGVWPDWSSGPRLPAATIPT
jgi:hypothetical protein